MKMLRLLNLFIGQVATCPYNQSSYSVTGEKSAMLTPQTGHTQSSGIISTNVTYIFFHIFPPLLIFKFSLLFFI